MNAELMAGIGPRLAAAREAKGLAKADIATQLKLSVRQVEALEADDFSHLPGEVFVRGFVRNYARLVDLNPDDLLPHNEVQVTEAVTAPSTNMRFRSSPVRRWLLIPAIGTALFFTLVAALYYWLSSGGDETMSPAAESPMALPAPASVSEDEAGAPGQLVAPPEPVLLDKPLEETPGQRQTPPSETAPAGPANPPTTSPGSAAAPVQGGAAHATPMQATAVPNPVLPPAAIRPVAVSAVAVSPTPERRPQVASPAVSAHGLHFQPAEDAWVQVVDGKGQRLSKLMHAGEAGTFQGVPPFRLVIGNAQTMRLSYNGRSIDLKPFIGEKVARLSLGEQGATAAGPASNPAPGTKTMAVGQGAAGAGSQAVQQETANKPIGNAAIGIRRQ